MIPMDARVKEILALLKRGDTRSINKAIDFIGRLKAEYYDEKWRRRDGSSSTEALGVLIDRLVSLTEDTRWYLRYASLRALKKAATSCDPGMARMDSVLSAVLRCLRDEHGRVRWAAVLVLDRLRMDFPDDLYVDLYLYLQDLYDFEEDDKKRKTLDQALDALYCLHLEMLLYAMGFRPMREIAG
jgi:HEAT repeat protein